MTDIPIIFSAPMILALLAGRKTQTRRLAWRKDPDPQASDWPSPWQRVKPGDRLWVRENIGQTVASGLFGTPAANGVMSAIYSADAEDVVDPNGFNICPWWKGAGMLPCIHMPRRHSRLTLIVKAVKIESLQNISEQDARAEGVEPEFRMVLAHPSGCKNYSMPNSYRGGYANLWCSLHKAPMQWEHNPEVVALTFSVHQQNIDRLAA